MWFWVLLVVALYIAYRIYVRFFTEPRSVGQEVTLRVWAAFEPHETAEDATECLRRVAKHAFAPEELLAQDQWLQCQVQSFNNWEQEGRFTQQQEKVMSALQSSMSPDVLDACKRISAAVASEAAKNLNAEFLEGTGHQLNVVERPDGSVDLQYNQVWSDEAIKQKEHEDSVAICEAIGTRLLADDSPEANALAQYLFDAYRHGTDGGEPSVMDIGKMWLGCSNLAAEQPESEISKTFKALNDAWSPNKAE